MEFLRKISRIGISTFIPFLLLAKFENTYIPYHENLILPDGEVTIYDIKLFFSLTMPALFAAACIIQYILIIPVLDKIMAKKANPTIVAMITLTLIVISFVISYLVWERSSATVILFRSIMTLAFTQVLYWIINISTLFLLDNFYYKKPRLVANI